jgi:hypothetical protein
VAGKITHASTQVGNDSFGADRVVQERNVLFPRLALLLASTPLFRISRMEKPQIIKSPLSRFVEEGGVSVDVRHLPP